MKYNAYYAARDKILEFIEKDAFGPIQKDEILQEPPLDSYVCGILWPRGTQTQSTPSSSEVREDATKERTPDNDTGMEIDEEQSDVIREANQYRPSVMAISFALPATTDSISVRFTGGQYTNIDKPVEGKDYVLHDYQRIQIDTGTMSVSLPKRVSKIVLLESQLQMQIVRRRQINGSSVLWTLSVENTKNASRSEVTQNISSVFQCRLIVNAEFCPIDNSTMTTGDSDRQKQDFLYRNVRSYAAGHGCSAEWELNGGTVNEVRSTFIPKSFVSQMVAVSDSSVSCFNMSKWVHEWREQGLNELTQYIEKYALWANSLQTQLKSVPQAFISTAKDLLSHIDDCIKRLYSGIATLRLNDDAWRAFCLMNKAMKRQSAKKRNQPENDVSWYPFQLCYVLMCIPDMTDVTSPWRDIVDLLWFPTGGGKTEAYLGVAAYTIFLRRLLKGEAGKGVTVLMRYTLRMLTSQQFERASALICECDLIRREEHLPGGEISIGLWVGSEVTPNHVTSSMPEVETAETILAKLQAGATEDVKSSPVQLSVCPYCGTPLLPQNAYAIKNGQFKQCH